MKRIILLSLIFGLAHICNAQAFGFRYGESVKQVLKVVGKSNVISAGTDYLELRTAPLPHPLFSLYVVWFSSKGLIKVQADTREYTDETDLRSAFDTLNGALESAYGKPEHVDGPISFIPDRPPLIEGLAKGELGLFSSWMCNLAADKDGLLICPENTRLGGQHIDGLVLEAQATKSGTKGYIRLSYEFQGWEAYVDQKRKAQNSVF